MKNKYFLMGFLEEGRERPWGEGFRVFFNPRVESLRPRAEALGYGALENGKR
jgi:hypothetical protein